MAISILLFVVGLGVLVFGAEIMVRGSAFLAKKLGVSALAIGLTVVAFGTSMPELAVNLFSAFKGTADIAIGNVVGSNIANILLILGISALIMPLAVKQSTVWKEIPFALLAMILVFIIGNDRIFDGREYEIMSRTDGLLMISLFIIFMYYIWGMARRENAPAEEDGSVKIYSIPISLLLAGAGVGALFFGGKLLVDNAMDIARLAGLSETLIGLTIVAVGTSLPELATSVVAAIHRQHDLVVGNIVGSNIFNIFWILGLTSTIMPLPFNNQVNIDVGFGILATLLLFIFMFIGQRHKLVRWQGAIFVILYAGYIVYLVFRG